MRLAAHALKVVLVKSVVQRGATAGHQMQSQSCAKLMVTKLSSVLLGVSPRLYVKEVAHVTPHQYRSGVKKGICAPLDLSTHRFALQVSSVLLARQHPSSAISERIVRREAR